MTRKLQLLLTVVLTVSTLSSQANEYIGDGDFRIFRDTVELDFPMLLQQESDGRIEFHPFDDLNHDERVFWLKIDSSLLHGYDFLYLSNYIEKIEAYYPRSGERYSITGKLISFEERSYDKGFYRNVLKIAPDGGTLYVRLESRHGYSFVNQSLSHLELVTAAELDQNQSQLHTLGVLLLGMEIVILIINLVLFYLRPNYTSAAYMAVIVAGLLMGFSESEIFVDQMELQGRVRQMMEIHINVLLIYCFVAFSAYYLHMQASSPRIFRLLTFPFFVPVIATAYFADGQFFPATASIYFLVAFLLIAVFLVRNYSADRERFAVYLSANTVVF